MISDGIRVNGKHSFYDFDLMIAERVDSVPEKNNVREKIPYMNGYYDFSAPEGEATWGERLVEYTFDIIGDTPQQVESIRSAVLDWLCNIHDADIFDDTMPEHHYRGSYDSATPDYDDSGLKLSLTVTFVCQPFRIANRETHHVLHSGNNIVLNNGQTVIGSMDCSGSCSISANGETQTISGTNVELLIPIKRGRNMMVLSGDPATLHYHAEVI